MTEFDSASQPFKISSPQEQPTGIERLNSWGQEKLTGAYLGTLELIKKAQTLEKRYHALTMAAMLSITIAIGNIEPVSTKAIQETTQKNPQSQAESSIFDKMTDLLPSLPHKKNSPVITSNHYEYQIPDRDVKPDEINKEQLSNFDTEKQTRIENERIYGEFAFQGTSIPKDVAIALVKEYRIDDQAERIAEMSYNISQETGTSWENVNIPFFLQENSWGYYKENLTGDFNMSNIRASEKSPGDGLHADYPSYEANYRDTLRLLNRYQTERNLNTTIEMLPIFAESGEERIETAQATIRAIRIIAEDFQLGKLTKADLSEAIHNMRVQLQLKYNPKWV